MDTFENSPEAVDVYNAARRNLIHKIGERTYYRGICVAINHAWRDYCIDRGVHHACIPDVEDMFPVTFRIINDILKHTSTAHGTLIWSLDRVGYQKRLTLLDTIMASREDYMDTCVKITFHEDGVRIRYVGRDDVFYGASK
jgi:hypothetical protein